jgi:SAM-dependent methyltransferase
MSAREVRRVGAREGYDRWAETYEATDNPVVAMDERIALAVLEPKRGERVLDAGCGTGRHLRALAAAGTRPAGTDFSSGMLAVAKRSVPSVPLARADLQRALPFAAASFDAVLCALVGEHLDDLTTCFSELHRVCHPEGRLVFTVYHPDMAAAGIEANFESDGVEYRLGAERHVAADYEDAARNAGWTGLASSVVLGDEALAEATPSGAKYVDRPLLLVLTAHRRRERERPPAR